MVNIFMFILGAAMGSFLNVLSDRLPQERSIMGRSHCEDCKHVLQWYDLVPIVSFLYLKGRCRYCRVKLSWYYLSVEIISGLMFVLTWNFLLIPGPHMLALMFLDLVIITLLLTIFFADAKFQIIPDSIQICLLIAVVLVRILTLPTLSHLHGDILFWIRDGLTVMLPLFIIFLFTKGRGMGFGDVKLAFTIGVLFGIKSGLIVLYIGFITGAVVGLFLLMRKKKKFRSKIAFGPFLVIGMMTMLFFQAEIEALVRRFWGI